MPKQKPQKSPVLILVAGGLLLLIAAALLLAQQAPTNAPAPAAASNHDEETYPEIERVSVADAKAAFDSGAVLFLDVRIADAYNGERIPGALNIPLGELETRLGEMDPNQWIITYCT